MLIWNRYTSCSDGFCDLHYDRNRESRPGEVLLYGGHIFERAHIKIDLKVYNLHDVNYKRNIPYHWNRDCVLVGGATYFCDGCWGELRGVLPKDGESAEFGSAYMKTQIGTFSQEKLRELFFEDAILKSRELIIMAYNHSYFIDPSDPYSWESPRVTAAWEAIGSGERR